MMLFDSFFTNNYKESVYKMRHMKKRGFTIYRNPENFCFIILLSPLFLFETLFFLNYRNLHKKNAILCMLKYYWIWNWWKRSFEPIQMWDIFYEHSSCVNHSSKPKKYVIIFASLSSNSRKDDLYLPLKNCIRKTFEAKETLKALNEPKYGHGWIKPSGKVSFVESRIILATKFLSVPLKKLQAGMVVLMIVV